MAPARTGDPGTAVLPLLFPTLLMIIGIAVDGANSHLSAAAIATAHLATALAVLVLVPMPRAAWRKLSPLLICSLFLLGWLLALQLGGPRYWRESGAFAPEFSSRLGVFAAFVSGMLLATRSGAARQAAWLLVVGGAFYAGGAAVLWTAWPTVVPGATLDPSAFALTLKNANVAGAVLAMLVSISVALVLDERSGANRAWSSRALVAALVACSLLVLCAFTASRAAFAAALLATLAQAAAFAFRGRTPRQRAALIARSGAIIALLVTGLLVAAALALPREFEDVARAWSVRTLAWGHYLALSFERPWFGSGLGSFRALNQEHLTIATAPYLWNFGAAHNFVVQSALDAGWPYVALGSIWWALLLRRGVIATKSEQRHVVSGFLCALAVALICGTVDIAMDVPGIVVLCGWLAGLIVGESIRAEVPRRDCPEAADRPSRRHPYRQALPEPPAA